MFLKWVSNLVGIQQMQYWSPIKVLLHYQGCKLYLWLQKKVHWKMSVEQVWSFMHRILYMKGRRMFYLSFSIGTVGYYIRYANIKVFLHLQVFNKSHFFISCRLLTKRPTTFKSMYLHISINCSKYVHFFSNNI